MAYQKGHRKRRSGEEKKFADERLSRGPNTSNQDRPCVTPFSKPLLLWRVTMGTPDSIQYNLERGFPPVGSRLRLLRSCAKVRLSKVHIFLCGHRLMLGLVFDLRRELFWSWPNDFILSLGYR
jgi:hypothetical protein